MSQPRQVAGSPAGGRFAATAKHESVVHLPPDGSAPSATVAEVVHVGNTTAPLDPTERTLAAFEAETEVRRFACEHHDEPGSCTQECTDLVVAMSSDDVGVEYVHDPDGVLGGPPRPYDVYEYDAEQRASVCVTHVPEGEALPETLVKGQWVYVDKEAREVDTVTVGRWDTHVDFASFDREPDGSPTAYLIRKFFRDEALDLVHPDDIGKA